MIFAVYWTLIVFCVLALMVDVFVVIQMIIN